jgi:hypothetical protein
VPVKQPALLKLTFPIASKTYRLNAITVPDTVINTQKTFSQNILHHQGSFSFVGIYNLLNDQPL